MLNSFFEPILMTGGSGKLGTELIRISTKSGVVFRAPSSKETNILKYQDILRDVKNHSGNTVVHCAAATDVVDLEKNIIKACEVNVIGTFNVLKACVEADKHLVFISTDYVFDGELGPYSTSDPINPLSVYAKSKASAELITRTYKNSTVIRTSFFGYDFPHPSAFVDQWSSKDYVDIIAPKVLECIKSKQTGVFHIGSRRRTIYEIAKERSPDVRQASRTTVKHTVPRDTSFRTVEFFKEE